ncbi:PREDICTED: cysteine-rich receptor-like protein kinase 27 [Camelina sativa]|uniref:Cysteine-rich receptor-like protein kinase 27 n=1 Tax=Camelina sativa TaxID=90675 RepID=A0ABM1QHJ5_CAMSA|nr:PREDICTED: cysteine-rich receptor-like protein kinase 27 [Camelina sativa]
MTSKVVQSPWFPQAETSEVVQSLGAQEVATSKPVSRFKSEEEKRAGLATDYGWHLADDFSLANKIVEGGFGVVYKGRLGDGQEIAVKRLSIHSGQGNAEFKTKVLLMTKLQHKNLVKLFGFSIKESEILLVYEFIPNTSLDRFLFDPIKQKATRLGEIIIGISQGLLYPTRVSNHPP